MTNRQPERSAARAAAAIAALTIALACPSARADGSTDDDADAQAKALFFEADRHYAAGRYDKAAKLFEEVYRLSQRPEILFNLGNCYERLGQYRRAAQHLRRYVDGPKARGVVSVRERIRRLEAAADQKQRKRDAAKREQRAAEQASAERSPAQPRRNWGPYIWLASGGVVLAGAVAFGLAALAARSDADDLCASDGYCPAAASGPLDREETFALITDVSLAIGTIAIGVGAYLLWRGRSSEKVASSRSSMRLVPSLVTGGGTIGLQGRF